MVIDLAHNRFGASLREPAVFLCPVCLRPLLGEGGLLSQPCAHVLLVAESAGLTYWRDESVREAFSQADRAGESGAAALTLLERKLGPHAIFFDLLEEEATVTVAIEYAARC